MVYRFIIQRNYFFLLKFLDNSKEMNIYEISREVKISSAHLSRVISQFASEKLLTKKDSDGRAHAIELTQKGKYILAHLQLIDDEMQKKSKEDKKDG